MTHPDGCPRVSGRAERVGAPLPLLVGIAVLAAFGGTGCSIIRDFDDFHVRMGDGVVDGGFDADTGDADTASDAGIDGTLPPNDAETDAGSFDGDVVTDAEPDASTPLTFEAFTEQYAVLACELALACEAKLGLAVIVLEPFCHPDAVQLLSTFGGGLIEAPGAVFAPDMAEACLDALGEMTCSIRNAFPEVCEHIFTPTLGPGAACVSGSECVDGQCVELTNACGSECELLRTMGSPCTFDSQCLDPLTCLSSACQPRADDGEPCESSSDCDSLLYCHENLCRPLPNLGEACSTDLGGDPCQEQLVCVDVGVRTCRIGADIDEACAFRQPCKPGLRCSETSNTCVDLVGAGEPCETIENCPSGTFACLGGECVARPILGESCTPLLDCIIGRCTDGTCTFVADDGACVEDVECESGNCETGLCQPKLDEGAPCSTDSDCAEGSECIRRTATTRLCTPC